MVDHEALAGLLRDFARNLVSGYQVDDILSVTCEAAVKIIGVSAAGVMLTDEDGVLRFVAASDDVIQRVEALQIELGEGPCLAAYETGAQITVPDLQASERFPAFGPQATAAGMQTLADVVSSYIFDARLLEEQTRLAEQLQQALNSRVLIEQAKGKVSGQVGLPVDEAFDLMRSHARRNGTRLRALAGEIVEDPLRLQSDDA